MPQFLKTYFFGKARLDFARMKISRQGLSRSRPHYCILEMLIYEYVVLHIINTVTKICHFSALKKNEHHIAFLIFALEMRDSIKFVINDTFCKKHNRNQYPP